MIERRVKALAGLGACRFLDPHDARRRVAEVEADLSSGRWVASASLAAAHLDHEPIVQWLASLGLGGLVEVLWPGHGEGVVLPFSAFARFFDDLWYPSADDVWLNPSPTSGCGQG